MKLYADEPFDLQLFLNNTPAAGTPVLIYRGSKLVHSAVTDQSGRTNIILSPGRKYRVAVTGRGTLDVVVLPQRSNLNPRLMYWYFFSQSEPDLMNGKKAAASRCPLFGEKAD